MSVNLDDLLKRLDQLPKNQIESLAQKTTEARKNLVWIPNPGPQTEAYFSQADVLLYGGEPGGGKSDLLEGLAFTEHQRSLIVRRQYTNLGFLLDRAIQINGTREGFNGSPPPKLTTRHGRRIDFGAAAKVGDEQDWMGIPHDFIGIDEACQFAKIQVEFFMGWLRSEDETQRTRVVLATNPPLTAEGLWIIDMFAPWLDDRFPNPAKPGELRWVVRGENDRDFWVDGPEEVVIGNKKVKPKSRTYIPAAVKDNPYYARTDYQKQLDDMPEVLRNVLLGHFKTVLQDAEHQVIPTKWVLAAQERWHAGKPKDIPMCAIGCDPSGGGEDPMVLAPRYDGWFDKLTVIDAKSIPIDNIGPYCAGIVVTHRRDNALVVIDMGGGYGGSIHDHLKHNQVDLYTYKGAEKSTRRTADRKLGFTNVRSAAYWGFREALDPSQPGGSPIALPDDPALVADLTAPTFEITPNGIKVEPKEKVTERLGRSTNHGDAAVMSWYAGPTEKTAALEWAENRQRRVTRPKVVMGRHRRH